MTDTSRRDDVVVMVGRQAWDRHGEELRSRHPDAQWLVVTGDGLFVDGEEVPFDEARPTVAWFGSDILRNEVTRPFYGLARTSGTLRAAITTYAGLDDAYWQDLRDQGAVVTNAHLSGVPISQFVLMRVLSWIHSSERLRELQDTRTWSGIEFAEVEGSTWLIVGLGSIGSNVAVRAKAFGAHVIGVRQNFTGAEPIDEQGRLDELPELVSRADVIVCSLPGSDATDDLFDAGMLARCKPTAALVNVGRGSLIDEEALLTALDAGQLAVAILDVTSTEPLPEDDPLWTHPSVMLSPHTSAAGRHRFDRGMEHFSRLLGRWIDGDDLADWSA